MSVRVKLNRRGFRQLRNSPEVIAELQKVADGIAMRAGPDFEKRPAETGNRARVAVVTSSFKAMLDEAKNRALTRAVK